MARLGRYFVADQPVHLIQRGNNRQPVFFDDGDYIRFRAWLGEAAAARGCSIYAYVFMTNHVHFLVAAREAGGIPGMMQSLGRRYVRSINALYRRSGTLWEGRYRAAPIDSDAHFISCCRYIELNPVRARMVRRPRDYRWSSYRAHAEGAPDPLLAEHEIYRALGATRASRREAYRALFENALDPRFVDELRAATNGGWAMGGDTFRRAIAEATGRRAAPLPRGRKPAVGKGRSQIILL